MIAWRETWILGLVLLIATACSRREENLSYLLFSGECQIKVVSNTRGAEILIDGLIVGHDQVETDIPCGEKQVIVRKEGFEPYFAYVPVTKKQEIKVTAELKPHEHAEVYALSDDFIEKVRLGKLSAKTQATAEKQGASAKPEDASSSSNKPAAGEKWDTIDAWL